MVAEFPWQELLLSLAPNGLFVFKKPKVIGSKAGVAWGKPWDFSEVEA
jgi:hypothetical protein